MRRLAIAHALEVKISQMLLYGMIPRYLLCKAVVSDRVVCNFSTSPGNDCFVGRVSIPDTVAQRLSGLESRPTH
jgi:hypothetical protein